MSSKHLNEKHYSFVISAAMNIFHNEKPLNLLRSNHLVGVKFASMITFSYELHISNSITFIVK